MIICFPRKDRGWGVGKINTKRGIFVLIFATRKDGRGVGGGAGNKIKKVGIESCVSMIVVCLTNSGGGA